MGFDEALTKMVERKFRQDGRLTESETLDVGSVEVNVRFNSGYNCCGGYDPDCYCSFAESATVEIEACVTMPTSGKRVVVNNETFFEDGVVDLAKFIREITDF